MLLIWCVDALPSPSIVNFTPFYLGISTVWILNFFTLNPIIFGVNSAAILAMVGLHSHFWVFLTRLSGWKQHHSRHSLPHSSQTLQGHHISGTISSITGSTLQKRTDSCEPIIHHLQGWGCPSLVISHQTPLEQPHNEDQAVPTAYVAPGLVNLVLSWASPTL